MGLRLLKGGGLALVLVAVAAVSMPGAAGASRIYVCSEDLGVCRISAKHDLYGLASARLHRYLGESCRPEAAHIRSGSASICRARGAGPRQRVDFITLSEGGYPIAIWSESAQGTPCDHSSQRARVSRTEIGITSSYFDCD